MQSVLRLLSFLLLFHGGAAGASDAVVDTNGHEVQAGQLYYVSLALIGVGGLRLASLGQPCPLYVVSVDDEPEPLAFFPENSREHTVREGDTLFIKFFRPTTCPQSSVWNYDVETSFVGTGGTTGPALDPPYSLFAIFKSKETYEYFNNTYQFKACPTVNRVGCFPSLSLGLDVFKSHSVLSGSGNDVYDWVFRKAQKEGAMGSKIRPVASRAKA